MEIKYTLDGKVIPLCEGQKLADGMSSRGGILEQDLYDAKKELSDTKQEVLELVMGQNTILHSIVQSNETYVFLILLIVLK